MVFIGWDERYSVGIREIDDQHMQMFHIINLLHESMKEGKGRKIVGETLQDLLNYSEYHFETEEKKMKATEYGDYPVHKSQHDHFREKVKSMTRSHLDGDISITLEVNHFLKDWLTDHILSSDQKMRDHFENVDTS